MAPGARLVAVYETERSAKQAAEAARRAGAPADEVRVGDAADHVVAVQGEMRGELAHTIAGPGNVGPFTKEMTKGMSIGVPIGGAIGVLLSLPFAAIDVGDFALWSRLLVVAIVGVAVGGTVGWIVGGAFAATRPEEPLAAERGITVTAPALEPVERALAAAEPLRIDLVDADGQPVETITSEEHRTTHDIGRHIAGEERDS